MSKTKIGTIEEFLAKGTAKRGYTINEISAKTGIEYPTTRRSVSKLMKAGSVVPTGIERKCREAGNIVGSYMHTPS